MKVRFSIAMGLSTLLLWMGPSALLSDCKKLYIGPPIRVCNADVLSIRICDALKVLMPERELQISSSNTADYKFTVTKKVPTSILNIQTKWSKFGKLRRVDGKSKFKVQKNSSYGLEP